MLSRLLSILYISLCFIFLVYALFPPGPHCLFSTICPTPVGLFKQTWLTPAVWKRRYCKKHINSGRSLAVIGIHPMLAQIVLVEQLLLHNRKLWRELAREQAHIGALFQHHGIVNRIGRVFTPGERAVGVDQHRRDLHRAEIALLESFDDHFTRLVFVFPGNFCRGHQARAGNGSVEIVRVCGTPGR